jgi:hypothetical protein
MTVVPRPTNATPLAVAVELIQDLAYALERREIRLAGGGRQFVARDAGVRFVDQVEVSERAANVDADAKTRATAQS